MDYHPPSAILRGIASLVLKYYGFRVENPLPNVAPKYLAIAVPHTANSDAPIFLCGAIASGVRPLFTVKHTAFKPPFGGLLRYLGGFPVNRTRSTHLVDQVVELYNNSESLVFTVTPEGTRTRTNYWKSGFYHMARRANVPIALGYIDYKRKVVGARPELFYPTGDIQKDMLELADFYSQFTPAVPENFGPVRVRPHETGE